MYGATEPAFSHAGGAAPRLAEGVFSTGILPLARSHLHGMRAINPFNLAKA